VLNVAQIGFFVDPQRRTPPQILQDWRSLVAGAEMAAAQGHRVTVIQACSRAASLSQNDVQYRFIAPEQGHTSMATGGLFQRSVRELEADIFHVHGLGFSKDVASLAKAAPGVPILLQDHADRVPRVWRLREFRLGMAAAAGIAFCALPQAEPFRRARLIPAHVKLFEISESTSAFSPGSQAAAREATELRGDPAILWVGHLNSNKDPLTVLDGVSQAVHALPALQLWCCFGDAPLLSRVQKRIAGDPQLAGRVHLLGRVPHETVEQLMRAADVFVLGSRREGSGYALIEALACGLPPVVTDIPSFRMLTRDGSVGALWACGASQALCAALIEVSQRQRPAERGAARAQFDRDLSFDAVGRKMHEAYSQLVRRTHSALAYR
jgi:glycosyltransferase involved in cell wall biosynthesis